MSNKPEEKVTEKTEETTVILNDSDLAQVNGGGNPFADKQRTPEYDYTEDIKDRV